MKKSLVSLGALFIKEHENGKGVPGQPMSFPGGSYTPPPSSLPPLPLCLRPAPPAPEIVPSTIVIPPPPRRRRRSCRSNK